jgi:hypothetical protein
MKKGIRMAIGAVAGVAVGCCALVGLSHTRDQYECSRCKALSEARSIVLFSIPIWTGGKTVKGSLTGRPCEHAWRKWFSNSTGVALNWQNWDGCFGESPWLEELGKQTAANQASQAVGATGAPPTER